MELITNAWFIGVGTGIVSGFIVTLLSRRLLTRKDLREYAQKVAAANREITVALRDGIPQCQLPNRKIIESLISATARKHVVARKDVYGVPEIVEELIKEVMDSSFISPMDKVTFCSSLQALKDESISSVRQEATESISLLESRRELIGRFSLMAGLLTAFMTMAVALLTDEKIRKLPDNFSLFIPMMVSVSALALTIIIYSEFKHLRKNRYNKSVNADEQLSKLYRVAPAPRREADVGKVPM